MSLLNGGDTEYELDNGKISIGKNEITLDDLIDRYAGTNHYNHRVYSNFEEAWSFNSEEERRKKTFGFNKQEKLFSAVDGAHQGMA